METIKGEVKHIVFKNDETGYRVFKVKSPKGPAMTMTGEFGPEIIVGTIANFHGDFKVHAKYGSSFRVASYNILHDKEELTAIRLFIDSIAPNIGPERALLIVSKFGSDTFNVIESTPEKLLEIPGIGGVSMKSLSEAWALNKKLWADSRQQYSLRAFLNTLGLKEKRIKKIIIFFGGGMNAEEIIREDPYILTQIEGFGFTTADYAAKQIGISDSDPARLRALILYAINVLCPSNGHMYLTKLNVVDMVNQYARETATTFIGKSVITAEDVETPINELKEKVLVHVDEDRIYSKSCFMYESQSASILSRVMEKKSDLIAIEDKEIEDFIIAYEERNLITLSKEQKEALYLFNHEKVFVITGCPGTGKTTVLKAIVELVMKLRLNLTCMTPTGISAKKMAETVKFDAYTIHRRLGYRGGEWTYNDINKFETDVVVVDEASMIDQEVLYRMLSALRDRVHLIFVGDHYQLPSVGAGNVLREFISCGQVPVVRLEQIFRQEEASDIIKVAHKIKNGDNNLDLFKPDPKADVFFLREQDPVKIENFITKLAQKFKDEKRLFQILSPRNQGPLSVDSLNTLLQDVLNPASPELTEIKCFNYVLRRGDRVLIKKNDYENEIFNGDIGKVTHIGGGTITLSIDEKSVSLPVDEIDEKIKLAYAITIHKCLPYGSLISTLNGLKKIEDVVEGDYVLAKKNEFKKVIWSGETAPNSTIRVRLRTGIVLRVSPEHEVYSANKTGVEFKRACILKTGEFVCGSRKEIPGNATPIYYKNKVWKNRNQIIMPEFLDEDLSWLIGALIGDGCYTDVDDGLVEYTSPEDIDLLYHFETILKKFKVPCFDHKKKNKLYAKYFCTRTFREWMLSIGMNYEKADKKTIPSIMFTANVKNRCALIAGLFDTDGSISDMGILRYTTASLDLAREFQLILRSIGIISFLKSEGKKHHKVYLCGLDVLLFREKIPVRCLRKKRILDQYKISCARKTNHYEIPFGQPFVPLFKKAFQNKEGESRGQKGKGLYSKYPKIFKELSRISVGKQKFRINALNDMKKVSEKEAFELPEIIKKEIDLNYYYDKIVSIEPDEEIQRMRDIEVEDEHSYSLNSSFVHNSQGQEYKTVILPFVNQHGKNMLQRNLLYTAITRAKEKVIVIGHASAIERAINNSSVHRRNTKLGDRIKTCLQLRKKGSFVAPPLVQEESRVITLKEPLSSEENRSSPTDIAEELSQNANTRFRQFMMQFSEPEM